MILKRLAALALIVALLPNPLWAASYKSSVRQLMVEGNPYCSAVAISQTGQSSVYLTAAHCYAEKVQTIDGHPIKVLLYNVELDLMLVQTEGYYVPSLWLGNEVKVGDRVMWAGYPRETEATYSQYWGEVYELHADLSFLSGTWTDINYVRFDEPHGYLNGNSGGAAIKGGKLVGIVVAQGFSDTGDPDRPVTRGAFVSRQAIELFLGL